MSNTIYGAKDALAKSVALRNLRRCTNVAVVALFAVLTVAVFSQVVARYAFNNPPAWTEELARFCQVWIVLLASSICIRKRSHLAVDYLGPSLKPPARRFLAMLIGILMVFFSVVVTIWGIRLMAVGTMQISPALQINMALVYAVFPISGALMVVEATLATLDRIGTGSPA